MLRVPIALGSCKWAWMILMIEEECWCKSIIDWSSRSNKTLLLKVVQLRVYKNRTLYFIMIISIENCVMTWKKTDKYCHTCKNELIMKQKRNAWEQSSKIKKIRLTTEVTKNSVLIQFKHWISKPLTRYMKFLNKYESSLIE